MNNQQPPQGNQQFPTQNYPVQTQGNQQFPTQNYPAQNFQPPVQQKKKKLPVWLIVIIVIVAIFIIGSLTGAFNDEEDSKNKDNSSGTSVSNTSNVSVSASEQETSAAAEKSKDDFIKECKTYTYKEIARNPANYEGKKAKFEGQVIQVMEDGDNVIMRVNITKEKNQFASGGYLYSDTVYVEYTRKSESESRILKDDIINMYGTLNGTKTYDTVLGSDTTIPYFVAEYIDIISD